MKSLVIYLNGRFVGLDQARVSVLDRGFLYGDGLFETLRAYQGKVYRADLHWRRFYRSAKWIELSVPLSAQDLEKTVYDLLELNDLADAYIRITLTRGESIPGLAIDPKAKPTLCIYAQEISSVPKEWYSKGVAVSLIPNSAVKMPGLRGMIKSCNYLPNILAKKQASEKGAQEAILLNSAGNITEGTVSNIFVIRKGTLFTPPLNKYVLPGTVRQVVFEIAEREGIVCKEKPLKKTDLLSADEAFLCNSGFEIVPVHKVDGKALAKKCPGELTRFFHERYLLSVDEQIQ